jgi:holo-[acyl-carrier protein] synthase
MIIGVGVDIVEIARIRSALENTGVAFARRVLSESEFAEFESHTEPARLLAKRWAIKEAFGKACGSGVRAPITLHAMTVTHTELGAPQLILNEAAQSWLQARGGTHWHISVSDERDSVVAFAVIETVNETLIAPPNKGV